MLAFSVCAEEYIETVVFSDGFSMNLGWTWSEPGENTIEYNDTFGCTENTSLAMERKANPNSISAFKYIEIGEDMPLKIGDVVKARVKVYLDEGFTFLSGYPRMDIYPNMNAGRRFSHVILMQDGIKNYIGGGRTAGNTTELELGNGITGGDKAGGAVITPIAEQGLEKRWIQMETEYFVIPDTAVIDSKGTVNNVTGLNFELKFQQPAAGTIYFDDFEVVKREIYVQDNLPPYWEENALIKTIVDEYNSVTVVWDDALDNHGVKHYDLYINDNLYGIYYGNEAVINDLESGVYTIHVVAVDAAGNMSDYLSVDVVIAKSIMHYDEIILQNGFEANEMSRWALFPGSNGNSLTTDSSVKRTGDSSLKMVVNSNVSATANYIMDVDNTKVSPGDEVKVGVWLYISSMSDYNYGFPRVNIFKETPSNGYLASVRIYENIVKTYVGTMPGETFSDGGGKSEDVPLSIDKDMFIYIETPYITIPQNSSKLMFELKVQQPFTGTVYFDDFLVKAKRIDVEAPHFDNTATVGIDKIGFNYCRIFWDKATDDNKGIKYNIYINEQFFDGGIEDNTFSVVGLDAGGEYIFSVEAEDIVANLSEKIFSQKIQTLPKHYTAEDLSVVKYDGVVKANVKFTRITDDDDRKANIILAVYDVSGHIENIVMETVSMSQGEEGRIEVIANISEKSAMAEAFVWNGLPKINSLLKSKTIKIK